MQPKNWLKTNKHVIAKNIYNSDEAISIKSAQHFLNPNEIATKF